MKLATTAAAAADVRRGREGIVIGNRLARESCATS
jgi:hypothetical protein